MMSGAKAATMRPMEAAGEFWSMRRFTFHHMARICVPVARDKGTSSTAATSLLNVSVDGLEGITSSCAVSTHCQASELLPTPDMLRSRANSNVVPLYVGAP